MFIADKDNTKNLGKNYSAYQVPYTKSESVLEEWAYYSIRRLCSLSANQSKMFATTSRDPGIAEPYWGFVNRMYSYYEGTWSGGSVEYLNTQYGQNNVMPARLINYPIVKNKIDWLLGQFQAAPVDLNITAINEDSVEAKVKKKSDLMFKELLMPFVDSLEQQTGVELEHDKTVPADIEKFMRLTYKQIDEMNMAKLIKYNFLKYAWFNEMSKGFRDQLLLGYTFMKARRVDDKDVAWRKCNMKQMVFDWGVEDDYGDDMMFIGEDRDMTLDQIQTEFNPTAIEMEAIKKKFMNPDGYAMDPYAATDGYTNNIKVVSLNWKACEERYYKEVDNPYVEGKKIYKILPSGADTKKPKKGEKYESFEKYDWWKGLLIGGDIVLDVEKVSTSRKEDDLNDTYGEYMAFLYNRLDKKPNGMMEMLEGLQELFNEIVFALELEIATSPGSVLEYDIRTKPKNVPLTDVFYHMKANKVVQVDKSKLGLTGGSTLQSHNLSPRASDIYINILMFIESMIDKMTGITQYSQGNVPTDTYVGTMRMATQNSNFTTKPYFTFYREGIRKMMKVSASMLKDMNNGKDRKLTMLLGELGAEHFVIKGDIPYGDYDFFFNDGTEDMQTRELLLQLGEAGLSSGTATFKQLYTIIKKKDLNEVYADLDKLADENEQRQSQIAEMNSKVEAAKNAQPMQIEQLRGEVKQIVEQMKSFTQKDVATTYAENTLKSEILKKDLDKTKKQ